MKFNLSALKGLFGKLAKSGVADDVAKLATNYGDGVAKGVTSNLDDVGRLYGEGMLTPKNEAFVDALINSPMFTYDPSKFSKPISLEEFKPKTSLLEKYYSTFYDTSNIDNLLLGALDVVDDIPTSISFDDIADTYQNRIPANKTPITPKEFIQNYRTNRDNRRYGEMMDELFPNYSQIGDPADAPAPTKPPMTNAQIENYVDMQSEYLGDLIDRGAIPEEYPFDYMLSLYDKGYKFDSTPDYDAMDIRPERFGAIPSLKNSIEYPDGFTDPDAFARYHTALQQGYTSEGVEPYIKDFQRKPSHASFSLNKPKLNVVELPELFNILYSN